MPHAQQLLDDLPLWAISHGATCWLVDLEPYEPCRVAGIVRRARLDPPGGLIEVTLTDGTAEVVARWSLPVPFRRPPVVPRTGLVLSGIPRREGASLVLIDPDFEVVP